MSSFARPLSRAEIDGIGEHARQRNAQDGITGVLLTLGSVFFQIIEGDDDAVDDLYERVLWDDRHTDILCLRTEQAIGDRLFPDWSMNVFDLDAVGGGVTEPLKLLLARLGEAQHIIERYTQPAVSRILRLGLNPLDVPLQKVDRLVLFTDMVAFSAISERLPIEDVSELVSVYLETCSAGIADQGGEVTKFLGDGVMAYFEPGQVDAALQACVDIQAGLREVRDGAGAGSALGLLWSGCGMAIGPVIEGSMGSSVKMDYTIIGEPVNTAARVEALSRSLGRPILMTEGVAGGTTRHWGIEPVGSFDICKDEPIPVFALGGDVGDMRTAVERHLDLLTTTPDGPGAPPRGRSAVGRQ